MTQTRVRHSIQELCDKYDDCTDRDTLQNLIRAFRKIQALPADDENSFFTIAGYHGEPFVQENPDPKANPDWWGGYCQHSTVLFPTWHRAYLLRLEDALRHVMPEANVSLPFWDQGLTFKGDAIPWALTSPFLPHPVDDDTSNPLYSYTLAKSIADNHHEGSDSQRYSKHEKYTTVRYPQSGLVGNEKDRADTLVHNEGFADPQENIQFLNSNVRAWLDGTVVIDTSGGQTKIPITTSVYRRYQISLTAKDYTTFSNRASNQARINFLAKQEGEKTYSVSIEDGHNGIHLAVGGFFQYNEYNANPIRGANGDMGENETASFDPIFYFHHAFIDYLFWTWQQAHHSTAEGSLSLLPDDQLLVLDKNNKPGDQNENGLHSLGSPNLPHGKALDLNTPLEPFKDSNGVLYTSHTITDITRLGYTYCPGSFDVQKSPRGLPTPVPGTEEDLFTLARVTQINRADYEGSFVVRTYAMIDGKKVEIGREPILSRWNVDSCKNCQSHLSADSYVPINRSLRSAIGLEKEADVENKLIVEIQSRDPSGPQPRLPSGSRPVIHPL